MRYPRVTEEETHSLNLSNTNIFTSICAVRSCEEKNCKVLHEQGLRKRKIQSMLDLHRRKPSGLKAVDNGLDGLGNSIKERRKETQREKRQRSKSKTRYRGRLKKENKIKSKTKQDFQRN